MGVFFRPLRRLARSLWDGLVIYGLLCVCGETGPYTPPGRRAPDGQLPPGHPERLLTDVALSEVERRLERELLAPPAEPGRAA